MFREVITLKEFEQLVSTEQALLVYFSTDMCQVCKVLKPKINALVQEEFPLLMPLYIDSTKLPGIAGQYRIFTAPTILVFFEGHETIRKNRNIGVDELKREIQRPYSLLFS